MDDLALSWRICWRYPGQVSFNHDHVVFLRFGLWLADLSINQVSSEPMHCSSLTCYSTQIQQEGVEEKQRGIIGGVQSSLQQLFNMAKFLLVILMPNPYMFGILILLSFTFVTLGAISMTAYAGLQGKLKCWRGYEAAATREPDLRLPD